MRAIHSAFELYASLSWKKVNWEKSLIYFGRGISFAIIRNWYLFVIWSDEQRVNYLGIPLFVGCPRQRWLIPWMDRILSCFLNWMGLSLSMACEIALVSYVIYGSLFHPQKVVGISFIEKSIAIQNFILSGSTLNKKPV